MIDWDYWNYLWIVHNSAQVCVKDFNGWLYFTGAETLGL